MPLQGKGSENSSHLGKPQSEMNRKQTNSAPNQSPNKLPNKRKKRHSQVSSNETNKKRIQTDHNDNTIIVQSEELSGNQSDASGIISDSNSNASSKIVSQCITNQEEEMSEEEIDTQLSIKSQIIKTKRNLKQTETTPCPPSQITVPNRARVDLSNLENVPK